jgi:alginate O-acetyltransferase complex protein AlgI
LLFNSYTFLLLFLPVALLIFHALRRADLERASFLALVLLSLVFYGYWNPVYLLLLVPLTLFNFGIASAIITRRLHQPLTARALTIAGIATNLGVLGYFKYANFFVDNLNSLFGAHIVMATIVLPLGISFFTFQKIAFLADAYRGRVERLNLLDFSLFVSFFPQLIAGPIVHHAEVLPQFRRQGRTPGRYLVQGATIFAIGLAKKVLLADTAALYATPGFDAVANGAALNALGAWTAALAYTAQLYFDFSGYSDMAIGGALMFGIRLPLNFASPYKATSIIDFWRRWHITLSRFLRDYLYISLGGNRHGSSRRYLNLMLTMLLGGLWHGAGWTYVIWGGLHGMYLTINHGWRAMRAELQWLPRTAGPVEVFLGRGLTFLAVVVGWVLFRAADFETAIRVLHAMGGANGLEATTSSMGSASAMLVVSGLLLIAWLAPNTQELVGYEGPTVSAKVQGDTAPPKVTWQPTLRWAVLIGGLTGVSIMSLSKVSEFLYFQF